MAGELRILDSLAVELEEVLAETTLYSVADPSDHVDLMQHHGEAQYPFIGIERFAGGGVNTSSISEGIGNIERVFDIAFDDGGDGEAAVDQGKRERTTIEIAAIDRDGAVRGSAQLLDEVQRRLRRFQGGRAKAQLLDDRLRSIEFQRRYDAARHDDNVAGERLRYTIEYLDVRRTTVPVLESINLTIESEDDGTVYTERTL